MPARPTAPLGLLVLVLALAACGSSGETSDGGTRLEIDGIATTGTGLAPLDRADPTASIPDPSEATQIDISGSVSCDGAPSGTGAYASTAIQICADLAKHRGALEQPDTGDEQVCAEVYGGPQHATITGTVDGAPVDVSVNRTNSCGIDHWQSLEWLLGAPER